MNLLIFNNQHRRYASLSLSFPLIEISDVYLPFCLVLIPLNWNVWRILSHCINRSKQQNQTSKVKAYFIISRKDLLSLDSNLAYKRSFIKLEGLETPLANQLNVHEIIVRLRTPCPRILHAPSIVSILILSVSLPLQFLIPCIVEILEEVQTQFENGVLGIASITIV